MKTIFTSANAAFGKIIGLCLAALLVAAISTISAQAQSLRESDFICEYGSFYNIVWDGWEGQLALYPSSWGGSYLRAYGANYAVRYQILQNPQNNVDGLFGPGYLGVDSAGGHRIVFWVDFANTPNDLKDDQRFDGYLMTQTRNAIAGVTWWMGIPFGFFATGKQCIPG